MFQSFIVEMVIYKVYVAKTSEVASWDSLKEQRGTFFN